MILQGEGVVQGRLIGGCLDVLEMLKGTEFWPEKKMWNNTILFLEVSEEQPNTTLFKRWIRNYGSLGILENINGIIFGRPSGATDQKDLKTYDGILLAVVRDELGLNDLPIMTQMDFGHTDPMFILPYGAQAEIDCENVTFSILEACTV